MKTRVSCQFGPLGLDGSVVAHSGVGLPVDAQSVGIIHVCVLASSMVLQGLQSRFFAAVAVKWRDKLPCLGRQLALGSHVAMGGVDGL